MWSLWRGLCGCTCDSICGHLGRGVKSTKSRADLWVRNSGFPFSTLSLSHCDFTSVCCERRTFKFIVMILTIPGHLLADCVVWRQVFLELLCEHRSPVMQGFHMNWGSRDSTWTGSERIAWDHPHCNWYEIAWVSCPHLGSRDALSSPHA